MLLGAATSNKIDVLFKKPKTESESTDIVVGQDLRNSPVTVQDPAPIIQDSPFSATQPSSSICLPTSQDVLTDLEDVSTLEKSEIVSETSIDSNLGAPADSIDTDHRDVSFSIKSEDNPSNIPIFDMFKKPTTSQIEDFFKFHPQQPHYLNNFSKIFYKNTKDKRLWLTYCTSKGLFFCSMCLAFSKGDASKFVSGLPFCAKRFYQKAEEHESSKSHKICVDSYIFSTISKPINILLHESYLREKKKRNDF